MSRELLEKWRSQAAALVEVRSNFPIPMRLLIGEAVDMVRFIQNYWEIVADASGTMLRPGLILAGAKLPTTIGTEILELESALQTAQTDYLLTIAPALPDVRARAEYVLGELTAALEWWLDDGIDDDRDRQLAALKLEYSDGSSSSDALAAELSDFAALARQEAVGLAGLGGFQAHLIDEAEVLAKQLRERPASPFPGETTRRALDMRNRIATLLILRMSLVRAAARFVFRNHPELVRQATSAFQRKRRALARRAARIGENNGPSSQPRSAPTPAD